MENKQKEIIHAYDFHQESSRLYKEKLDKFIATIPDYIADSIKCGITYISLTDKICMFRDRDQKRAAIMAIKSLLEAKGYEVITNSWWSNFIGEHLYLDFKIPGCFGVFSGFNR